MSRTAIFVLMTLASACTQKMSLDGTKASATKDPQENKSSGNEQPAPNTPPEFPFYGTWAQCITSPLSYAGDNSVKSILQVDTFSESGPSIHEQSYFKDKACKVPFTLADNGKTFKPLDRGGPTGAAEGPNYAKCGQPIDYSLPGSLSVPEHWCIEKLMGVDRSEHYFEMSKLEGGRGCYLYQDSGTTQLNGWAFEMRGDKLKTVRSGNYYINRDSKDPRDIEGRASALQSCEEALAGDGYDPPYYSRLVR